MTERTRSSLGPNGNLESSRMLHLDAWRGVAIILVVIVHVSYALDADGIFGSVANYGKYGVQLFFILSAYLLAKIYWIDGKLTGFKSRLAYLIKRFLRIAPAFYLGAFLYTGLVLGMEPRYSAPEGISYTDVAKTVFLVHWITPTSINSVVPGGWSIAAEWTFYILFLLLASSVRRSNRSLIVLGIIVPLVSVGYLVFVKVGQPHQTFKSLYESQWADWIRLSAPIQLPVFYLGLWAAQFDRKDLEDRKSALVLAIVPTALLPVIDCDIFFFIIPSLIMLALFLYFPVNRIHWMVSSILGKVGTVSYSIYIFHFGVVGLLSVAHHKYGDLSVPLELQFFLVFPFVVLASSFLGAISYKFVEKPGMNAARHLIKKWAL